MGHVNDATCPMWEVAEHIAFWCKKIKRVKDTGIRGSGQEGTGCDGIAGLH